MLISAHVADVTGAPLPLLFLVLCRWSLAVAVVAIIVIVMSNYVVYGDCVHLNGGPLSHAHCTWPLHLHRIKHLNIMSGPSACAQYPAICLAHAWANSGHMLCVPEHRPWHMCLSWCTGNFLPRSVCART